MTIRSRKEEEGRPTTVITLPARRRRRSDGTHGTFVLSGEASTGGGSAADRKQQRQTMARTRAEGERPKERRSRISWTRSDRQRGIYMRSWNGNFSRWMRVTSERRTKPDGPTLTVIDWREHSISIGGNSKRSHWGSQRWMA